VKDFSALEIKKFDLELTVDPLFKKTSADFDEGGAKGLLLNHLSLDVEGRIIFDASDAIIDTDNAPIVEVDQHDNIDLEVFRGMKRVLHSMLIL
jgi:condensin complex subunit 2